MIYSGRGLSKCGKCLQYMKLISSQPSRLYCGTCEEIYYAPQKGTVKQKVYVKGGKKEEAVELDVYNQGMLKTELCNKWQQTGACPYGENCQFAHGVAELQPVLRHPHYKTEVCRMVLNGIPCPYGHRCHFHHSLTQQVQLIKAMNNSRQPIKYR